MERSLGNVSVVQIALAVVSQASCFEERFSYAMGTRARILEMGRCWPMTPVDITSVLLKPLVAGSEEARHVSTALLILTESSNPFLPVTAFAHPELMIIARIPSPFRFCNTSRLTVTGAAWNLFLVKTAAPAQGVSEITKARSGNRALVDLTPTWVPETTKPLGYVPRDGTYFFLAEGMLPEKRRAFLIARSLPAV